MNIDSSGIREYFQSILSFAVALVVLGLIGIFGPASIDRVISPDYDLVGPDHGSVQHIVHSMTGFSSLNRFLRVSFDLLRGNSLQPLNTTIQYAYQFRFLMFNGEIEELKSELNQYAVVNLRAHQQRTPRFVTLSDVIVDYTLFNLTLSMINPPKEFSKVQIQALRGSASHTYFQICFRIFFACASLVLTFFFFSRLRRSPSHSWHFEQKLTLPLLILVFFYNNPFYPLQAHSPSRSYVIFDTISRDVFHAYFRFFILALFDSLRFKNRKTTNGFYVPKVAIVLTLFISSVVHGIYDNMGMFGLPRVGADHTEKHLRGTELTLFGVYVAWAAGSIVLAGLKVDITERYKFGLYVAAGGTALGVLAFVRVLFDEFAALRNTSLRFVARFGVENGFVWLMAFFHWARDPVDAKELDAVEASAAVEQDPDLFVDGEEAVV